MTWDFFKSGHLLVLACCGVLSACAAPDHNVRRGLPNFSAPAATEVINVGLENIADKYIDSVDMAQIGKEGLRGLGAIDADLSLMDKDGQLVLFDEGVEIARLDAPIEPSAEHWAKTIISLTESARAVSPAIRASMPEKIYEAVFDGALSDLDIFSRYAGVEEARRNRAKRDGFGGIGIRFRIEEGFPEVTDVMPDTPADTGGLQPGDRLLRVGTVPLSGMSRRKISEQIRGPVHTPIKLLIDRPNQEEFVSVEVERAHIVPPTVFTKVTGSVAQFRVTGFNQHTAQSLRRHLVDTLQNTDVGINGVVLDLRGNPGGLLRQSIKVADLFLTQGDILKTHGRHPDSLHHYQAGGKDLAEGLPMVVLIDGKSASAAEIVAAALQDRGRAVVIGTGSYGKGSVQTVVRLPNEGELTLTWSKFVAPSGYILHGLGVVPTLCTSGYSADTNTDDIIDDLMNSKQAAKFDYWRHRSLLDNAQRKSLRDACPAEARKGTVETALAGRLLSEPPLHARALGLSTATAATN